MALPGKLLISAARIQRRVRELARDIARHYKKKPLTVVGLMNGGLFFTADLARQLPADADIQIECWQAASYRGKKSTGKVSVSGSRADSVRGRHVLLVDDILDSGRTLSVLRQRLLAAGADSVKICVLLSKNTLRTVNISADWAGFVIGNHYVIGYGLDDNHYHRLLPMIRALD